MSALPRGRTRTLPSRLRRSSTDLQHATTPPGTRPHTEAAILRHRASFTKLRGICACPPAQMRLVPPARIGRPRQDLQFATTSATTRPLLGVATRRAPSPSSSPVIHHNRLLIRKAGAPCAAARSCGTDLHRPADPGPTEPRPLPGPPHHPMHPTMHRSSSTIHAATRSRLVGYVCVGSVPMIAQPVEKVRCEYAFSVTGAALGDNRGNTPFRSAPIPESLRAPGGCQPGHTGPGYPNNRRRASRPSLSMPAPAPGWRRSDTAPGVSRGFARRRLVAICQGTLTPLGADRHAPLKLSCTHAQLTTSKKAAV